MSAGTVTTTGRPELLPRCATRWPINWTSDASGNVSVGIDWPGGTIERVTFWHDPVNTPTNLYDVTLTDEDGIDILGGRGANIASASNTSVVPIVAASTDVYKITVGKGWLTLTIANAGNAKGGRIVLHF
jgi:hypothetical protein